MTRQIRLLTSQEQKVMAKKRVMLNCITRFFAITFCSCRNEFRLISD